MKCWEEPDQCQDKMRSSTFAIEVIIERLKRDCDLIPSVKYLGTPCLVHEKAVLIIGIFERS